LKRPRGQARVTGFSLVLCGPKLSNDKNSLKGECMLTANLVSKFHDRALVSHWVPASTGHSETKFSYTYENFFHPLIGELLARLNTASLAAVMDAAWQNSLNKDFFQTFYQLPHDRLANLVRNTVLSREATSVPVPRKAKPP
jgi:hypothetical protein